MLNPAVGSAQSFEGRATILTSEGKAGHAVYGPYALLDAGNYLVTFNLRPASADLPRQDVLCAVVDVAADNGNAIVATKKIFLSQFAEGREAFTLAFTLPQAMRVEYRVWVSGRVSMIIEEHRRAVGVEANASDLDALIASNAFPAVDEHSPAFFRDNLAMFRHFYEQGMRVSLLNDTAVITVEGVSFNARTHDDLNFLGEIFQQRAYNLKAERRLAVIDVGMNIGLTSLMLATKPEVVEIVSFEPFANTFDRALDNIALNPTLAAKITAHQFGLSDTDWDGTMTVGLGPDSGSRSTISVEGGQPVHLSLRNAADVLRPVIERAEAQGLAVIVKLDCEGSEFAIVRSLADAGLIGRIAAFMVEWHAMFSGHDQETLLAPMRAAGFLVFDQSPPTGNGFFYAVRMPSA